MLEHHKVASLLVAVIAVYGFLFGVSYTSASFQGTETPIPELFSPAQISSEFDQALTVIADNLRWSVSIAMHEAKRPVLNFRGLSDYKFGQPRYTALRGDSEWQNFSRPQVLGAYTQQTAYYR